MNLYCRKAADGVGADGNKDILSVKVWGDDKKSDCCQCESYYIIIAEKAYRAGSEGIGY